MKGTNKASLLASALLAGMLLAGCTSNGDGNNGGSTGGTTGGTTGGSTGGIIPGGGGTGGPPNDGTAPTTITKGGNPVTGNFICTVGAKAYGDVTTETGANGLVGGPLTTLLNLLGGTTVTQLLNSVSEPDNIIDGNLSTFATFSLTAGLITGLLDSVDESVLLPKGASVPAGKFAVFGISFPDGTVDLSLLNSVKVSTFLKSVGQESVTLDQNALTLLGAVGGSSPAYAFVGVETTKPYDQAQISLTPGVITASVGDAMHVYELCTDGRLVTPPTP